MNRKFNIAIIIVACFLIVMFIGIFTKNNALSKPFALLTAVSLAISLYCHKTLNGFQYTVWIIVAVLLGMLYPSALDKWGDFDIRNKYLKLTIIQLVMFGMGTHMKLKDFSGLASTGKGVAIGLFCHFSIMPLMGLLLTKVFHFEPEIAAGIILIGSCSSGLASNVMVYLAKANLPLSVIVTAMATLVAPLLTPLLMKLLAGKLIEVKFLDMMLEIIKIVIIPIFAALVHDYLLKATSHKKKFLKKIFYLAIIVFVFLIYALNYTNAANFIATELIVYLIGAYIFGVLYHYTVIHFSTIEKIMPYVSMFGIFYFTTITTATGREHLLKVGFLLFIASVIHNAAGYFFGYWLSRFFGMDKNSSRTIAFEVGLQNGGMAIGIASKLQMLGTLGLPAAVFSPWMNISGSILANYWRNKNKRNKDEN
jgi:bile acid:Na+ symporter, BASS family